MDGLAQEKENRTGTRRPVYFKILLVVLGVAAVASSAGFGWYYITDLDRFKVRPGTFSFNLPSWAKIELFDEINKEPLMEEEHSIFEKDLTKMIAGAYAEKPWVKKVHFVKKEFPNNLKIKFTLRKPFAVVKVGKSFYLLDDEGVRLPEKYYSWPDGPPETFYIKSNRSSKKVAYWEKCSDEGIMAGVEMIKFIKAKKVHELFNIRIVDVSRVSTKHRSTESDIVLITKNGTKIKWGRSSFQDVHGELSDTEKLQNLLSVAKVEGRNLRRMEYVDVRWDIPQGKRRTPF